MTEFNRYAMMMEALTELKPEIDAARQLKRAPAMPPLDEVLAEFGPLPPEALFLGVASDGLPLLLNLHDPIPGPILIAGDSGTGKTALLQTIAAAAGKTHQPEELQFGALTSHPDEWSVLEDLEVASNLDFDARQNLRWLLLRGPARRVWPIITVNTNRMENILPWLDAFHTRVFGAIKDSQHVQKLAAENAELNSLNTGSQFVLREGDDWLRFWIPSID